MATMAALMQFYLAPERASQPASQQSGLLAQVATRTEKRGVESLDDDDEI